MTFYFSLIHLINLINGSYAYREGLIERNFQAKLELMWSYFQLHCFHCTSQVFIFAINCNEI